MQKNRSDTQARIIQLATRRPQAAKSMLAMPLDLLAQLSDGLQTEFVLRSPTEGLEKLDVTSNGHQVATFAVPPRVGTTLSCQQLCAANDPTIPYLTFKMDQWWDYEMLNEPIPELPDFEL